MASSTQSPFSNMKSPVMRNLSQNQGTSSPYLPGYLFGGSSPAPQTSNNNNTPSYGHHKMQHTPGSHLNNRTSISNLGENRSFHAALSPYGRESRLLSDSSDIKIMRKDKPGAPPTESLYSMKKASSSSSSGDENTQYHRTQLQPVGYSFGSGAVGSTSQFPTSPLEESFRSHCNPDNQHDANALKSPAQIDPFYTQGDDILSDDIMDETAITVFGFPPSACSFVLQQFSQYGKVEKYEVHNHGNWMHIKYQTKLQAKKALSKNGKIFARTMMIGVCGCIKKDIANLEATYNNATATDLNKTPTVIGMKRPSSTSIRSLSSASANLAKGPMSPLVDKNTPQKKDSVVSRTLDYVFGW